MAKEQNRSPEKDLFDKLSSGELTPEEYVAAVKATLFGTSQEMGKKFLEYSVNHPALSPLQNEMGNNLKKAMLMGMVDPHMLAEPFKQFVKEHYEVSRYAEFLRDTLEKKGKNVSSDEIVAIFRKQGIPIRYDENKGKYEIDDLAAEAMAWNFVHEMRVKSQAFRQKFQVASQEVARNLAGAFHFMTGNVEAFMKWLLEEMQVWLTELTKELMSKGVKLPHPIDSIPADTTKEVQLDKPGMQVPELDLTQSPHMSPHTAPSMPAPPGPGGSPGFETPELDLTHNAPQQGMLPPKPHVVQTPKPVFGGTPRKQLPGVAVSDINLAKSAIDKVGSQTFGTFVGKALKSALAAKTGLGVTKGFAVAASKAANMGAASIESFLGQKLPRSEFDEQVMQAEQQLEAGQEREVVMEPKSPKPPTPG